MFGSRKNSKSEKCLKMAMNPANPLHALLGGISFYVLIKIRTNHNQKILSVLLHSADYGDVFDLSHHKG